MTVGLKAAGDVAIALRRQAGGLEARATRLRNSLSEKLLAAVQTRVETWEQQAHFRRKLAEGIDFGDFEPCARLRERGS